MHSDREDDTASVSTATRVMKAIYSVRVLLLLAHSPLHVLGTRPSSTNHLPSVFPATLTPRLTRAHVCTHRRTNAPAYTHMHARTHPPRADSPAAEDRQVGPPIGPRLAPSFPHTQSDLKAPRSFLVQLPHSSDEETVLERDSDTPKVTLCVRDKRGARPALRPLPTPGAPGWAQTQNSSVPGAPNPSSGPWAWSGAGAG